ncbi:MAG: DUF4982 domain-containing protein [Mediterranea sp.]|jgi:beta-galactosidase|nr:DUF4982 domain-containing protein [Mediterranea sp.]
MNQIQRILLPALLLVGLSAGTLRARSADAADVRQARLLNFGWKFHFGDAEGAQSPTFDDSGWRAVDLPHDFQIEQPWNPEASPARGFKDMSTGWYRKHFAADEAWRGKRVLIDFEGIMLHGDAWLNGTRIGGTDYGYLGFEADVSRLLRYDGDNVLAVRANTGRDGDSRWYTGGGLYRDVHLLLKDTISIARDGVFVSTPRVADGQASVSVQVEVEGVRGKRYEVEIEARILGPDGREVAVTRGVTPMKSKKWFNEVTLPEAIVGQPNLWSCESPSMYEAVVTISHDGHVLDRVRQPFGIRTLEYSPEFGFKLNGQKVLLKGISNHHDLGAVGVAAYERSIDRMFRQLKAFGYNHVRCSHNPYSKSFLRLADKYGILVVDELFDKWGGSRWPARVSWAELWPDAVTRWVKRDRNHPSVILWSLGNEMQVREEWAGYPTSDWGVTSYRVMDVMLKRYDPTRKSTVAMFPARKGAMTKEDPDFNIKVSPPELSTVTDVASYNYRYPAFPKYAKEFPHLIFYQSEAATDAMGKAFYGMDLDKVVGLAYWGAIDYWGESHGWPRKGWNYSFFDHTLQPLPQAYFIKSIFSDEPLVRVGVVDAENEGREWNDIRVGRTPISSHWNRRPGSRLNIVTYTNADEVELLVNGRSQGTQKNTTDPDTRNTIRWTAIPYAEGEVTAIARTGGREVARHQLRTTGRAVALRLEAENPAWQADGLDLQYIHVTAVDSKGRVVPGADAEVTFELLGDAARLIAVDSGNHSSDELFADGKRKLYQGRALGILRSTQQPGTVTLKVSAPGLRGGKLTLSTTDVD